MCVIVMVSLWMQNRRRTPEVALWLADIVMTSVSFALITMRGVVPDFLSVVVANVLVVAGAVLLLQGLERYNGVRGRHWHNYVMLVAFTAVHAYFTYVQPNSGIRGANSGLGLFFVSVQVAWLMLHRVDKSLRATTRATGAIFVGIAAGSLLHVVSSLQEPANTTMFGTSVYDALSYLTSMTLLIATVFSLVLMVNRRLFAELEEDIAEKESAQEALAKSEMKFSAAFHTVPDAILITHVEDGSVIDVNAGCLRITGLTREQALGKTTVGLGMWADPLDRERYIHELTEHGRVTDFECVLKTASGATYPADMRAELMDVDGERAVLTVFRDATASKIAEEQLRRLSNHDPLTGILNYRAFNELATERLAADEDARAALIFLDFDQLKSINDKYGHPVGDEALVAFAGVLATSFRDSDTIGRVGGDEFAVLALSREDASDEALLDRFAENLRAANEAASWDFELSASIGIAWRGDAGATGLQDLISLADSRMYEAKNARS